MSPAAAVGSGDIAEPGSGSLQTSATEAVAAVDKSAAASRIVLTARARIDDTAGHPYTIGSCSYQSSCCSNSGPIHQVDRPTIASILRSTALIACVALGLTALASRIA